MNEQTDKRRGREHHASCQSNVDVIFGTICTNIDSHASLKRSRR